MPAYKDTNGTYFVSFYYEDFRGVKKRKMKRGFARRRDALDWERRFLLQSTADLNMKFSDFVEIYRNDKQMRIRESTWESKNNMIDLKILPYFKDRPINAIEPKDIIAWQNEIMNLKKPNGEPYSTTYLKSIHSQLSAIFNHAVRYYRLQKNPAEIVGNMGKDSHKEMLFWTKDEYLKFAKVVMDKPTSYYAFEVLYWCGIRLGELLALTASDFNFERQTLTINKSLQNIKGNIIITPPKTPKSNRTIKIPQFLVDEMQDYIKSLYGLEPDDRIFPISKAYLHHEMNRGAKAAGVKRIRIHDLRHPYVKHTTKIFSLRLMDFQAQAYPDARRKTRGACQLLRVGQSRSPVRPLCNRKRFSCLPPQSKMSWILYAISMRLSGYTSTRSISSSASSVVSVSASKIALDASMRLSCRACSSCFCFACANTAA